MVESSVFHPSFNVRSCYYYTERLIDIIMSNHFDLIIKTAFFTILEQARKHWNAQLAICHRESPVSCYYYTERFTDIIMSNHFDLIIKTAFFTILKQARKHWNAQMIIRQWSSNASLIVHVSYVMDTISSSIFRLTFGGNCERYYLSCVGAGLEDVE